MKTKIMNSVLALIGMMGLMTVTSASAWVWKSVHYHGCRRIVTERHCHMHHGYRYCRIVKWRNWVC